MSGWMWLAVVAFLLGLGFLVLILACCCVSGRCSRDEEDGL